MRPKILMVLATLMVSTAVSSPASATSSGVTTRATVAYTGGDPDGESSRTVISGDGRYIVYHSEANNLAPGDLLPTRTDVFRTDLLTGATDLGGTTELITPGVDGDLATANDPLALAAALRPLLADPERSHQLGGRGRRKVHEHFSPEVHLARLGEVYAEALQASARPDGGAARAARMAQKA